MKIFLSTNDEFTEVSMGDTLELNSKNEHPNFGTVINKLIVTLTPENINFLIDMGAIKVEKDNAVDLQELFAEATESLRVKFNYKTMEGVAKLATKLNAVNPSLTFNMYMRELAIILDRQYPDHINKSETLYVFGSTSGKIEAINPKKVKNFRNFAAFRTLEDAKIACVVLKPMIKQMFNGK